MPHLKSKAKHNINQSPFFKLKKKTTLSGLLRISLLDLTKLIQSDNLYRETVTANKLPTKIPDLIKKPRAIQIPSLKLAQVQKTLLIYINKIETPSYLFSCKSGADYIDNARIHINNKELLKVDIKSFFNNAAEINVYRFFKDVMQCSLDVTFILTKLVCYKDHLPTGGCLSPIMSYYAYSRMFEQLFEYSLKHKLTMTVYIDDIVFSGERISYLFKNEVEKIIRSHKLVPHKIRHYKKNEPKIVTGVAVKNNKIDLPHARRKKIRLLTEEINKTKNPLIKHVLVRSLCGMTQEAARLSSNLSGMQRKYVKLLKSLNVEKTHKTNKSRRRHK